MNQRFALIVLTMTVASLVSARELFVDNVGGSDLHNDFGLATVAPSFGPYRTIARALVAARQGDTIVLTKNDEPYRECISLVGRNHSGTRTFPFRIIGNGATLDGTTQVDRRDWEPLPRNIYRYKRPRFGYATFFAGDKSVARQRLEQLSVANTQSWAHQDGYIYLRTEEGKTPADDTFSVSTERVGITLYDVEYVIISDLTIRGYRLDGINANDKANGVELVGISARHNGRSGICVGGSSSVTIGASLCEHNGVAQLRTEGQSHTYLANVDLPAGSTRDIQQTDGEIKILPKK